MNSAPRQPSTASSHAPMSPTSGPSRSNIEAQRRKSNVADLISRITTPGTVKQKRPGVAESHVGPVLAKPAGLKISRPFAPVGPSSTIVRKQPQSPSQSAAPTSPASPSLASPLPTPPLPPSVLSNAPPQLQSRNARQSKLRRPSSRMSIASLTSSGPSLSVSHKPERLAELRAKASTASIVQVQPVSPRQLPSPRLGQCSPSSIVRHQGLDTPRSLTSSNSSLRMGPTSAGTTPRRTSSQSYTQLLSAEAQERIQTLEAQLAHSRKKADKLYARWNEDSRRLKKLYTAFDTCTAQRDNYKQQLAGYKIVVGNAEEQLRISEKRQRYHTGKIELLRTNLVGAYLQIEEERLENAQLRSTIAQLSRKLGSQESGEIDQKLTPVRRLSDTGSDETLTLWASGKLTGGTI